MNNNDNDIIIMIINVFVFLDLCIIVITELEVRVQVPSIGEWCSDVSDRGGDDPISVVPVQEGVIVTAEVVTDLRETWTTLVNWMPGGGRREGGGVQ